jgi:hypothetical protein
MTKSIVRVMMVMRPYSLIHKVISAWRKYRRNCFGNSDSQSITVGAQRAVPKGV